MENDTGTGNPQNANNPADYDNMDADALRNLLKEKESRVADYEEKNKQLFERAKKAEGFTKQSDGSWVKVEKKTPKKDSPSDKKTEDSALTERIDALALRAEGIKDEDEVGLAQKIKEETGKQMDEVLGLRYFQSELKSLREDKTNRAASSGVPDGGGGGNSTKTTAAYWMQKGMPPTREEVSDRATRMKIVREMGALGKSNKKFYND